MHINEYLPVYPSESRAARGEGEGVVLDVVGQKVVVDSYEYNVRHHALNEIAELLASEMYGLADTLYEKANHAACAPTTRDAPYVDADTPAGYSAEEFVEVIALASHVADMARDMLVEAVRAGHGVYFMPLDVLASAASRNKTTLLRSMLKDVEPVDNGEVGNKRRGTPKSQRVRSWEDTGYADVLEQVRVDYPNVCGRTRAAREATTTKDGSINEE